MRMSKVHTYTPSSNNNKEIGWFRDGYDICYYQNNMKRKNGGFYYTLTFAVKFQRKCTPNHRR